MINRLKKYVITVLAVLLFLLMTYSVPVAAASPNYITSAEKISGGKWKKTSAGRRYKKEDGTYASDKWYKIGSSVYYFNVEGYSECGWFELKGKKYCASKTGKVYFGKWKKIEDAWYYFKENGHMAHDSMFKVGSKYYYVDAKGVRASSELVKIKKKYYYFNSKGVRVQKKWLKLDGKYYYFHSNGKRAASEWIGDYYVGKDGARMTNCVVDGYQLDENGKKTGEADGSTVPKKYSSYIFLGDSRMEGMRLSVSTKSVKFIAKVGMGYAWLNSTAGTELKTSLNSNAQTNVILALGVNDLGNIDSYISYYKKLMKSYPKTDFYILSVNPVDEAKEKKYGYSVTEKQIKAFNKKIKAAFPDKYLDSYTYLKEKGFSTADGIHYTADTYKKIYQFIIK